MNINVHSLKQLIESLPDPLLIYNSEIRCRIPIRYNNNYSEEIFQTVVFRKTVYSQHDHTQVVEWELVL